MNKREMRIEDGVNATELAEALRKIGYGNAIVVRHAIQNFLDRGELVVGPGLKLYSADLDCPGSMMDVQRPPKPQVAGSTPAQGSN